MRLETDRLALRSLRPDDVEPLVSLWADPEVTRFLSGPRDTGQVRAILQEELVDPPAGWLGQWPLVEKVSGDLVGDCGLISKEIEGRAEVELVYVLATTAWGNGYATEIGLALLRVAREELKQRRVVSLIEVENAASKHVAEKLGMHLEAMVERPDGVERELWAIDMPLRST